MSGASKIRSGLVGMYRDPLLVDIGVLIEYTTRNLVMKFFQIVCEPNLNGFSNEIHKSMLNSRILM